MKRNLNTTLLVTPEYRQFIEELKSRVISARISAARAITHEAILLYWDIGRGIVEQQESHGWGDSVVELIAKDLRRAFPDQRGFSSDSVWRIRQFYSEYTAPLFLEQIAPEMNGSRAEFLEQDVPEMAATADRSPVLARFVQEFLLPIPWGHHIEIMKKIKAPAARLWYLRATARFGWSRNVLLNQIKTNAYERAVTEKKTHNFQLALPEYLAEQADEMQFVRNDQPSFGVTAYELQGKLFCAEQLAHMALGKIRGEK